MYEHGVLVASFPGLHAQLSSDKSWAWRPGNEASVPARPAGKCMHCTDDIIVIVRFIEQLYETLL